MDRNKRERCARCSINHRARGLACDRDENGGFERENLKKKARSVVHGEGGNEEMKQMKGKNKGGREKGVHKKVGLEGAERERQEWYKQRDRG